MDAGWMLQMAAEYNRTHAPAPRGTVERRGSRYLVTMPDGGRYVADTLGGARQAAANPKAVAQQIRRGLIRPL